MIQSVIKRHTTFNIIHKLFISNSKDCLRLTYCLLRCKVSVRCINLDDLRGKHRVILIYIVSKFFLYKILNINCFITNEFYRNIFALNTI